MSQVIVNGEGAQTFLFAHGAGAGMDHDFMTRVAEGIAEHGIRVVRFNFPYMVKRSEDGKKRPPDRAPKLLEAFEEVIERYSDESLVIGGKSMGGAWRACYPNLHTFKVSRALVSLFTHQGNQRNSKVITSLKSINHALSFRVKETRLGKRRMRRISLF